MKTNSEEFYVGYLEKAPPALAAFTKKIVIALFALAALFAVILVSGQSAFYPSFFEFGVVKTFEGTIVEKPYPMLKVERPGQKQGDAPASSHLYLVAFGKFGAAEAVQGVDGQRVRLQGSLIYRDGETMIEILDNSIEKVSDGIFSAQNPVSLTSAQGTVTLVGEIVDSKCFLGVMNPGHLKPHRACAIRCISGGIPPVFVVKSADGPPKYFLLISPEGKPVNQQVLSMVAEPVRISGEVEQQGDLLFLRADPATYQLQ